jgi:hypothetical protein
MHSWHIAFQVFSKVLNLILQRILFNAPFSPILDTKGVLERKYFKNEPHCYGAILYFPLVNFF